MPANVVPAARRPRLRRPHNILPLPLILREVPATLELTESGGRGAACAIAAALLDAGVLRSADWTGNLSESIQTGLVRWINDETGGADYHSLPLEFFYTDDLDSLMISPSGWAKSNSLPPKTIRDGYPSYPRIGGFGLALNAEMLGHVAAGRRLLEIEDGYPGAGLAVLALIEHTCAAALCGATPGWARDAGQWYYSWDEKEPDKPGTFVGESTYYEDEDTGAPTLAQFYALVPRLACYPNRKKRWQRTLVEQAFDTYGSETSRGALAAALALDDALHRARYSPSDRTHKVPLSNMRHFHGGDVHAFILRWSDDDPISRIVDDHTEDLYQNGDLARIELPEDEYVDTVSFPVFLEPFCLRINSPTLKRGQPGSIEAAIQRLRSGLDIIVALDKLLGALHSSEKIPPHLQTLLPLRGQRPRAKAKSLYQVTAELDAKAEALTARERIQV